MIPLLKRLARHLIFGKPRRVITPYAVAHAAMNARLRKENTERQLLDAVARAVKQ